MAQSLNVLKEFGAVNIGSTPVIAGGGGGGGNQDVGLGYTFTIEGTPVNRMYVDNNNINFGLPVVSSVTTASTSSSTGAVKLSGGIGISNTTDAVSSNNGGSITTAGGAGIAKQLFVGGKLSATDTTDSTSSSAGSIVSSGGIGINSSTDATSYTNGGALTVAGGMAVAKKAYFGSLVNLSDTTASTSSSSGSFVLSGGLSINNSTDATSSSNGGSLTTAGGIGISKNAYFGSNIYMKTQYAAIVLGNWTASAGNPSVNFLTENTGSAGIANARIQAYGGSGSVNSGTLEFNAAIYNLGSSGILTISNTTSSTANNNGALVSSGGIGITKTTNSASSTNGGTITTAGGVGIAKDLFVGGNIQIDGAGWAIFPNRTGCGRVPNLTGDSLQVAGGILTNALTLYNSSNTTTSALYVAGADDINYLRNYNNIATLLTLNSKSGNLTTDNREATLALVRSDDGANAEFMDVFNNGYFSGTYPNLDNGIRIQKRGIGVYRDFVIQYSTGLDDVNDALRIDANTWQTTIIGGKAVACSSVASAPTGLFVGQEYYDTVLLHFYKWNGSAWLQIDN